MQVKQYNIPQMIDDLRTGKMPRNQFLETLTTMGVSVVGANIIAAAATHPMPAMPLPQVSVDEDEALQLQLHDRHLADRNAWNISALQNDYAEDAVVEGSMYFKPFVGRTAIAARMSAERAAFPDLQVEMTSRVVHGNQVTVEWIATGTHLGDLPGFPASNRSISIAGMTVVIRRDDKIVRESLYYDVEEVQRQLSGR